MILSVLMFAITNCKMNDGNLFAPAGNEERAELGACSSWLVARGSWLVARPLQGRRECWTRSTMPWASTAYAGASPTNRTPQFSLERLAVSPGLGLCSVGAEALASHRPVDRSVLSTVYRATARESVCTSSTWTSSCSWWSRCSSVCATSSGRSSGGWRRRMAVQHMLEAIAGGGAQEDAGGHGYPGGRTLVRELPGNAALLCALLQELQLLLIPSADTAVSTNALSALPRQEYSRTNTLRPCTSACARQICSVFTADNWSPLELKICIGSTRPCDQHSSQTCCLLSVDNRLTNLNSEYVALRCITLGFAESLAPEYSNYTSIHSICSTTLGAPSR